MPHMGYVLRCILAVEGIVITLKKLIIQSVNSSSLLESTVVRANCEDREVI